MLVHEATGPKRKGRACRMDGRREPCVHVPAPPICRRAGLPTDMGGVACPAQAEALSAMVCPKCAAPLEKKDGTWFCTSGGLELSRHLGDGLEERFGAEIRAESAPLTCGRTSGIALRAGYPWTAISAARRVPAA